MGIIQDKANEIAGDMHKNEVEHRLAFDIMIIVAIAQVIYYVIGIYKQCNQTPKQAASSMRSGGILERFRLRRAIRHCLNDRDMQDHLEGNLLRSTLNVSQKLEDHEVEQMYEEANKPFTGGDS